MFAFPFFHVDYLSPEVILVNNSYRQASGDNCRRVTAYSPKSDWNSLASISDKTGRCKTHLTREDVGNYFESTAVQGKRERKQVTTMADSRIRSPANASFSEGIFSSGGLTIHCLHLTFLAARSLLRRTQSSFQHSSREYLLPAYPWMFPGPSRFLLWQDQSRSS